MNNESLRLFYLTPANDKFADIVKSCMSLTLAIMKESPLVKEWIEAGNHGKIVMRYKGKPETMSGKLVGGNVPYYESNKNFAFGPGFRNDYLKSVISNNLRSYPIPYDEFKDISYVCEGNVVKGIELYPVCSPRFLIFVRKFDGIQDGKIIGQIMHAVSFGFQRGLEVKADNTKIVFVDDETYYKTGSIKEPAFRVVDAAHTIFEAPTETLCLLEI